MAESDEYGGPPGTRPPGQEDAGGPPGPEDFFEDDFGPPGGDFGGPPGPGWGPPGGWRGRGGFRGGPPPRFMRGGPRGQFGPPMRGRGGFGPPPNGFGPRGPRPRGPPPHGWGGDFGPPGGGGPPMGMGGPPPHWGGPPGGWDAPGMDEGGPPDEADMEKKDGESSAEKAAEDLDVDLNGEVWVETKTDSGKSYFYNARTRQTTWERPEEKDGVRVLSQEQVDKLTQKLANNEKKESEQQQQQQPDQYNMPPYGMPPPGYGGPQGYPPHQGYPPPWAQGGQGYPPGGWGGMPPQGMEVCDWSEHTAPDGKKYYYNGKSGESVWEKPQELLDFEHRQSSGGGPPGVPTQPPVQSQPSPVVSKEESKPETPTKVQVTKAPAVIPEKAKPADKSRPVSSTPVHGTPWCVVWTGDNKAFFYNPSTKTSVWERPPDLIGRSDVTEMLKSPAQAEKQKAKNIPPGFNANPMAPTAGGGGNNKNKKTNDDSDGEEVPAAKKKKVELVFEDELKAKEDQSTNGGNISTKSMGKDAAMEAEVKAARERQLVPLEKRMAQFQDLLTEKKISAFSTWEKELHKIVFDSRYLLLTSKERKQVFDKYVRERADEERREKKNRLKEAKDNFNALLTEAKLSARTTYSEFANKYSKDERFKGIEKSRERESLFNEFMVDIKKKDREERAAKKDQAKKDFMALLKEFSENPEHSLDRHSRWNDVKKKLDSDSRYKAVDSSSLREDYFLDFVHELKEDSHRDSSRKSKKKDKKRSRSRSRSRRRSRSRSRDRKEKKSKKDKRDRSKDRKRSDDEAESSRKDKKKKKSDKDHEKEEGEMTEEETDSGETKKGHKDSNAGKGRANGNNDENSSYDVDKKDKGDEKAAAIEEESLDPEERERRDKEERVAASLKKREAEVAKELSGHLHARDKEREQHRRSEAILAFQALLTDLIKHPDYSWKEAKKVFKKDSRYDNISDNLEKSERERLFDEHIDFLVAKKKENYRKLLDECKSITLDSSFKDIKKLIKDDPRYSRYSSSERKCEKQFNEYIKDRIGLAKSTFRQLLMETKFITDKSMQMVRDKETGHLAEVEELLKKDKRYLDLEMLPDERKNILFTYLEELEKRGPPPPPTASEPSRRGGAP